MNVRSVLAAVASLAGLALGGAAQASELHLSIRMSDQGWTRPVADYGLHEEDRYGREGRRYRERRFHVLEQEPSPTRFYGRPVVERHRWHAPVFAAPHWDDREEVRIIVRRRVDPWGDVVIRRKKICS